ncbi:helix-turn-helix transcriptional regulator [Nanoarchaeota archaeon]
MKLGLLLIPLLLINIVLATEYSVDFDIAEGKVLVDTTIKYDYQTDIDLLLDVLEDAKALSLYLDGESVTPILENNKLIIKRSVKEVNFNYLTEQILEDNEFIVSLSLLEADKFSASLFLEENSVLAKPIEEKTLSEGSVYPTPTSLSTDGQRIKLIWEKDNVEQGDDFSIFVQLKQKTDYIKLIAGLLLIVIILIVVVRRLREKPKKKVEIKKVSEDITKHLKEDEETVINVLKQRDGQCEQGTLRVVTGFPKATLSRILKELEDRKVVYKEKRGKKNLVFLK